MRETIELFSPDHDLSGRYGRDFAEQELGLGRIVLREGMRPIAFVKFFDIETETFNTPFFEGSNVELIDAITNDDDATRMIEGTIFSGKMRGK